MGLWGTITDTADSLHQKYRDEVPLWARKAVKYGSGIGYAYTGGQLLGKAYAAVPKGVAGTSTMDYGDQNMYPPTPTSDTSGGGTDTDKWQQVFGGNLYTNPTLYLEAITQAANDELTRVNNTLKTALDNNILSVEQYEDAIKANREDVKKQHSQMMGNISGKFSMLSPQAYQSSQADAELEETTANQLANEQINTNEARLAQQRTNIQSEYANKVAQNTSAMQGQTDATYNQLLTNLAGTDYANTLSGIEAPKMITPTYNSNISSLYNNLNTLAAGGETNKPAMKQAIDSAKLDPGIVSFLYGKYGIA